MTFWRIFWLLSLALWALTIWRMHPGTRRPWYSPSGWVSSAIFQIAQHVPHGTDADMILGAIYGVVEVCGIRRALQPLVKMALQKVKRG